MSPQEQKRIVLYTSATCPFAQRARIALLAAGAAFEVETIDLQNKPAWYKDVNPALKVPALSYGSDAGSPVSAPSPGAFLLPESLLIVDFVADLFPSTLDGADAVERAKSALLAHQFTTVLQPTLFKFQWDAAATSLPAVLAALRALEPYVLPPPSAPRHLQKHDIAAAPFAVRFLGALERELGVWTEGDGRRVLDALQGEDALQKVWGWFGRLREDEFVKATWDEELVFKQQAHRLAAARAA